MYCFIDDIHLAQVNRICLFYGLTYDKLCLMTWFSIDWHVQSTNGLRISSSTLGFGESLRFCEQEMATREKCHLHKHIQLQNLCAIELIAEQDIKTFSYSCTTFSEWQRNTRHLYQTVVSPFNWRYWKWVKQFQSIRFVFAYFLVQVEYCSYFQTIWFKQNATIISRMKSLQNVIKNIIQSSIDLNHKMRSLYLEKSERLHYVFTLRALTSLFRFV